MPNISSLNTALTGMNAQRRVLDVTAHNVANASTVGYHRQRVDLRAVGRPTSGVFSGTSQAYGVDIAGVNRAYDQIVASRAVREEAGRSAADLTSATMDRIEAIFPEPTDLGLAHQLDESWGSWTDVANDPGSTAARTQLLEHAGSLVTALHRASAELTEVADASVARMSRLAVEANRLGAEIASLNGTINQNPEASLDLLDQRDLLVTELAQLTGAVARPGVNGQVDIYINGRTFLGGNMVHQLDGTTGTLVWQADSQPVNPTSGEAAAVAATIGDIVPRYRTTLDGVAAALVTSVNAVHTAGYDQSGTTGRTFFDPAGTTAATISLSTDVAGQPANVAAGAPVLPGPVAPGPLDGEQARAMAALAESATGPDSIYHSMITTLAVETRSATQRANIQAQVADAAVRDADSVGSVSLDEEMANLTAAQRAFEAAARVLTTIDEMLGFLIERTGVVGR